MRKVRRGSYGETVITKSGRRRKRNDVRKKRNMLTVQVMAPSYAASDRPTDVVLLPGEAEDVTAAVMHWFYERKITGNATNVGASQKGKSGPTFNAAYGAYFALLVYGHKRHAGKMWFNLRGRLSQNNDGHSQSIRKT